MRRRIEGYAYLTIAMILVGSTVVVSKILAENLPPFTATALRFAVAFPILLILMGFSRQEWPRAGWRDWLLLILQAAAGSVGYTTLLISGLRFTSAADTGVIIGILPVVTALVAIVLLGERPHRYLLMSIGIAAFGLAVVAYRPGSTHSLSLIGNALILGAVGCEALFILLNQRLRNPVAPLALSTLMSGFGLALAGAFAVFESSAAWTLNVPALLAVLYYAVFPTVVGFILWYAGAARVSGSEASMFTAVAPIAAVLLSAVILEEEITIHQTMGGACVLASLVAAGWLQIRGDVR